MEIKKRDGSKGGLWDSRRHITKSRLLSAPTNSSLADDITYYNSLSRTEHVDKTAKNLAMNRRKGRS